MPQNHKFVYILISFLSLSLGVVGVGITNIFIHCRKNADCPKYKCAPLKVKCVDESCSCIGFLKDNYNT
jgi:hypothetical protein